MAPKLAPNGLAHTRIRQDRLARKEAERPRKPRISGCDRTRRDGVRRIIKPLDHRFPCRGYETNYGIGLSIPYKILIIRNIWRRGRDSNPRSPVRGTTVFETAPFDRSGTSPQSLDSIRAKTNTGRTPDVATHSHSPPPIYFAFTTREACPLPVSPRQWRQIASSSLHG